MKLFAVALVLVSSLSFAEVPATGSRHADVPTTAQPTSVAVPPVVKPEVTPGVPTSKCAPERPQQSAGSSFGSAGLGY